MAREIKVRAWDGKEFLPLAREVAFIDDTGVLRSRIEGIIFNEYTGVKDRQDKEIYEGDILGLDDPEDQSRVIVVFHNGAFRQRLVRLPIFGDDWDWLVIGNIYENPDLVPKEG